MKQPNCPWCGMHSGFSANEFRSRKIDLIRGKCESIWDPSKVDGGVVRESRSPGEPAEFQSYACQRIAQLQAEIEAHTAQGEHPADRVEGER